jgi:hypothetical protein
MINGKVEKTYDEQFVEKGVASMIIAWNPICDGIYTSKTKGEIGNFRVDSNPNQIVVGINDRVVIYEIKDIVSDALELLGIKKVDK